MFEPDLIRDMLTNALKVTLGYLIFGEEQWKAFSHSILQQDDPLTALYHEYRELGVVNMNFYHYQVMTLVLEVIGGDTKLIPYDTLFSNENHHPRKVVK